MNDMTRAGLDDGASKKDLEEIRRISPQFYLLKGSKPWSYHLDLDKDFKFIIQDIQIGEVNAPRIIPPPPRIDYLNGKAYYIRSRVHPEYFWDFDWLSSCLKLLNGAGPTTFIIERDGIRLDCKPEEDVLIDSDEVTVTAIGPGGRREVITHIGELLRGSSFSSGEESPLKFKFGMLTKRRGFGLSSRDMAIYFSIDGLAGDRWELVD